MAVFVNDLFLHTPRDTTGHSSETVPVIIFHGDRDTTVDPCNADHLLAYYVDVADSRNEAGGTPLATVRQGGCPAGTPTPARFTVTTATAPSWSGGTSTSSGTLGREEAVPAPTPTPTAPTPPQRWRASF